MDTRIPQEISSKLDTGIPKSAPNWIPESRKKSAPNWIPESRKEISSKLYQNPAGNWLQIGYRNPASKVSKFQNFTKFNKKRLN
ncbi:unnamed protein product [Rhizophagus irregularis]|nr:unnamed protein product [Rhizophagus irregularis]CAB5391209.1 unnamed protein product [Rhizophagus irregularis]